MVVLGSVARGEAKATSDIDLLIEIDPEARVGAAVHEPASDGGVYNVEYRRLSGVS